MTSFTMGCDPEFYVTRKKDGLRISAHELVPGTKKEPHKLPSGGHVQADGVAIEFNIPPSSTSKEYADNISAALNDIRKMVPSEYAFNFLPYVMFSKVYFEKLPDAVKELGCDPDYNAYNGLQQPSPSIKASQPYRCFGGHIHVGWGSNLSGPAHMADCCAFVKNLTNTGVLPYTDNAIWHLERQRQTIYGMNGSFRPKPYGVEWRSPPNTWLGFGPAVWSGIFEIVKATFDRMTTGVSNGRFPYLPTPKPTYTM